jgi:type I restriction enzyme S subunit
MSNIVPDGWSKLVMGNIGTFSTSSVDKKSKDGETHVSLLNYMDIYQNSVLSSSYPFQSVTAPAKQVISSSVKNGDVFFTPSSETPEDIGHSAVFIGDVECLVHSYHTIRFRPMENNYFDDNYKAFGFRGEATYEYFRKRATGSTRFTVSLPIFNELEVLCPPLPEQKKIASILTSVDEVIENTQKQIDKLQDLKKATMNELLTKGIGHTEFKDTELGRIPKSWEVKTLGDMVLKITDGEHLSPDIVSHGKPILSAKDIREDGVHISGAKFVEPTAFQKMLSRCNPEFGDVLVVSRGATIGRVTLNNLNIQFALMGSVILIKPAQEQLIGSFISLYLESETTQSEILGLSGSSAQQAIYLKDIKSLKLPVPRLIEQNRIAALVKSIDDQKKILKSKLSQTQSLKKSLMQDLLTGKIRVTVN